MDGLFGGGDGVVPCGEIATSASPPSYLDASSSSRRLRNSVRRGGLASAEAVAHIPDSKSSLSARNAHTRDSAGDPTRS